MSTIKNRLPVSLFLLRLGVFLPMFLWSIDKILNPEHAARVFEKFYFLPGLGSELFLILGILQTLIVVGFVMGLFKKYTYGLVLGMHLISTVASYQQFLNPYDGSNLLFFAALPMLSACFALFVLRDEDTFGTVNV